MGGGWVGIGSCQEIVCILGMVCIQQKVGGGRRCKQRHVSRGTIGGDEGMRGWGLRSKDISVLDTLGGEAIEMRWWRS